MSTERSQRRLLPAAIVGATIVALSCLGDSSGPTAVPAHFAVAPSFTSANAGIVPLSQAVLRLTRSDGTVALDTTVSIAPGDSAVDLAVTVVTFGSTEVFQLTILLLDENGDTAFAGGPVPVSPTADLSSAPIIQVDFDYTGVGSDAAGVLISPSDTTVLPGDTARFEAVALDSSQNPIPGTPIAWSSTSQRAVVLQPDEGLVVAGSERGAAGIVATLLTGPADTATLNVAPQPTDLVAVSGSGQTAGVGAALAAPLVARVLATDGLGVPGVPIVFRVASGGGSLSTDTVITDDDGQSAVTWTLGPVVGEQAVEATTPVVPGDTANFLAIATGGGGDTRVVTVVAGDGQAGLAGTTLPIAPRIKVEDGQGVAVAGAPVSWSVVRGGGDIVTTAASSPTDTAGVAELGSWTLGAVRDTNLVTATVDTFPPATFTAVGTGANGAWELVKVQGDGQSAAASTPVDTVPTVEVRDTAGTAVPGVPVVFAVTGGEGTVGADTVVTDSVGQADPGSWTLGPTAGSNTLTVSSVGLIPVTFTATGTVGAPDTVVIVSGNEQTADADSTLSQPLVVEVRDAGGNPVPGVAVDWTALQGTLQFATTTTGANGQTQNSWTLGNNAIDQTATAAVSGLTPAVFSATAVFQNPSILLALVGTTRIPVGDSAQLDVTLSAPAPAGGVTVTVTSDNPSRITVQDDGIVFIDSAGTSGSVSLVGLTGGTDTVRAAATGYADAALPVEVSVQVLSLPATLNVPFGGTASLPVQISSPAPAGGVVVTLVSDNPSAVGVQTPTVTIAEGSQTTNA
ncbi:MAG: hypothetical protein PVH40_06185, partial [Gemmatimonadales bacterium]